MTSGLERERAYLYIQSRVQKLETNLRKLASTKIYVASDDGLE